MMMMLYLLESMRSKSGNGLSGRHSLRRRSRHGNGECRTWSSESESVWSESRLDQCPRDGQWHCTPFSYMNWTGLDWTEQLGGCIRELAAHTGTSKICKCPICANDALAPTLTSPGRLAAAASAPQSQLQTPECRFYSKTGACPRGSSCQQTHTHPILSKCLVFRHMFQPSPLPLQHAPPQGSQQTASQHALMTASHFAHQFTSFFKDISQEFARHGPLQHIYICRVKAPSPHHTTAETCMPCLTRKSLRSRFLL
ncbi:hypothetical protein BC831DRAFT_49248 [Entophlyctis helioformis]|nr:hypothetical protein BC831DRAFT_49248 [Entophlyctis helioformis]